MYSFTLSLHFTVLHLETTGADDLTLANARAIIKVLGHLHQWFPVFPRWLQCKTIHFQG